MLLSWIKAIAVWAVRELHTGLLRVGLATEMTLAGLPLIEPAVNMTPEAL